MRSDHHNFTQSYFNERPLVIKNMKNKLDSYLTQYVPKLPKQVQLQLPKLKKIELPKLKKVEQNG